MLASAKLGPDFSRGCARKRIGDSLFATLPHRPAIRKWFCATTVPSDSHRGESLFTAPISCIWEQATGRATRPFSARIGVGICRIVDLKFRELLFPRTPVNKAPIDAPDPSGWHHGVMPRPAPRDVAREEEKRLAYRRREQGHLQASRRGGRQ
jgi:hypothetical protein